MADNEQKQTPTEYVPPSQIDPAELTKLFVEDGVITPEKAAEVTKAAPAESSPPPSPQPSPPADETPTLLKIAKANADLRKKQQEVGPHLEMLKVFSPQEAQRLAQARASGDPVAALAALGFTHSQYVNKLGVKTKPEAAEPEGEKPAGDPEFLTVKQELAALKAEREAEKLQSSRQQALGKMREVTKDNPKFASINSLNDHEGIERVLLNYWAENNSLPGETFEESVLLAAEVHEADLRKQAERYRPLLTGTQPSAQVPSKAPESPRPASESPRTLTNANTTAPAAARTVPKTEAEVLQLIINGEDLSHLG